MSSHSARTSKTNLILRRFNHLNDCRGLCTSSHPGKLILAIGSRDVVWVEALAIVGEYVVT